MADAFRERLLHVLDGLRPQTVPLVSQPTPIILQTASATPAPFVQSSGVVQYKSNKKVPWELLLLSALLAGLGVGFAVATLVQLRKKDSTV